MKNAKGKGSRAINRDLNTGKQSRLMFASKPATKKPLVSNENEDPSPPAPGEISKLSKSSLATGNTLFNNRFNTLL